jgi:hypothetical protein
MTCEEFSNEFDILLDSYRRFKHYDDKEILDSIEFNEYEKSVFLTEAQENIIISLYNGKNPYNDSFEKTEELRRYLSPLVKTDNATVISGYKGVSEKSKFYKLPDGTWFITYEAIKVSTDDCLDGNYLEVIPITQDDYHRIKKNPFRGANNRRALRLDAGNNIVEVISNYEISDYLIRYIKKPAPIILVALSEVSINNISVKTECELHPALHRRILEEAVRIALSSKSISNKEEK